MKAEVDVDVVGRCLDLGPGLVIWGVLLLLLLVVELAPVPDILALHLLERRQPVNIVVLRLRLVLVLESVSVLMLLFVHFFAFLFRSSKIMEGRLRAGKWMNYIREEHKFWLGKNIEIYVFSLCLNVFVLFFICWSYGAILDVVWDLTLYWTILAYFLLAFITEHINTAYNTI